MTGEVDSRGQADGVPEAAESVHLPEPSYLPILLAFGITIALVGVVINWVIVGIGVVIFLVVLVRWIRQTREEMADLPLEHGPAARALRWPPWRRTPPPRSSA